MKYRGLGTVADDDFLGVHYPEVAAPRPADGIGQPGICVNESRLDFEGRLVVHSVTMNDVSNLKSGHADVADALEFVVVAIITFQHLFGANVRENPIACAFSYIKRLAISRVN
jgi:hypothetical protein